MDIAMQESIDESMRLVVIGDAVLTAAEENPQFATWLEHFLDMRLTGQGDRELFDFLTPLPGALPADVADLMPPE